MNDIQQIIHFFLGELPLPEQLERIWHCWLLDNTGSFETVCTTLESGIMIP